MTARKLNNTNPIDMFEACRFAVYGEDIHLETTALNPHEYAGYTAATMIPGLNDTDWEVIYEAVNEAVEKAAQGDPDPEKVLLFDIPSRALLAVIELFGYVPTNTIKHQGYWTGVHARLLEEKKQRDEKFLEFIRDILMSSEED